MWVVLLDRSSSMNDPFESDEHSAEGRTIATEAKRKFDAARQALIDYIAGLPRSETIALFCFNDSATLLRQGTAGERGPWEAALASMEPGGSTDLAAALDTAAEHLEKTRRGLHQALIVSDGLSDREKAHNASERLAELAPLIHVILIDPTKNGLATAQAVMRQSSLVSVESEAELGQETARVAAEQTTAAREFQEVAEKVDQAVAAIAAEPAEERLGFSAAYPASIAAGVWYSMLVSLHLTTLADQVREMLSRAQGRIGTVAATATGEISRKLKRGTRILLRPNIPGVTFNPESHETAWWEDVQTQEFRLTAGKPGLQAFGVVEMSVEGQLIGLIPVALRVRRAGEPAEDIDAAVGQARMFERVFACYSHQDRDVVDACARVYTALGIYMYVDHDLLRSGQQWRAVLADHIQRSDVFQLFWSKTSSESPEVRVEWEQALNLQGRKGEWFVRPLFWEEKFPEPPPELKGLHFYRLELESATRAAAPEAAAAAEGSLLPAAIVPLVGATGRQMAELRSDLSEAIRFLETVTGLRYYPVPTLLVDDYLVRTVRKRTVVEPRFNEARFDLLRQLASDAQSISVGFHNGYYEEVPQPTPAMFGSGVLMPDGEFKDLRGWAEAGIRGPVESHLRTGVVEAWKFLREKNVAPEMPDPGAVVASLLAWAIAELEGRDGDQRDTVRAYGNWKFGAAQEILAECGIDVLGDGWTRRLTGKRQDFAKALEKLGGVLDDEGARSVASALASETQVGQHLYRATDDSRPVNGRSLAKMEEYGGKLAKALEYGAARLGPKFQAQAEEFSRLWTQLLDGLHAADGEQSTQTRWFAEQSSTHGIYAACGAAEMELERWTVQRGLPPALALPGTPRVLFCAAAQERNRERLLQEKGSDGATRLARAFQKCVLIHEHFHAVLENGLDGLGDPARGPRFPEAWNAATPLNESLAVWMELHAAREDAEMADLVRAYMKQGEYPDWPYAGGEWVETVYQEGGVEAVRALISRLRDDPAAARENTDCARGAAG